MDDSVLLKQFRCDRSEAAFADLVRRHVNLVYSAARRQVHSDAAAEDVAQQVFVLLAEKARTVRDGEALAGWLLVTTRFVALNTLRAEARRRAHERKAAEMRLETDHHADRNWEQLAALLDEAVGRLKREDRDALAMSYFQGRSVGEVAAALKISPEAAHKRVYRAVERLRTWFADRGIATSNDALSSLLMANAIVVAPATLTTQLASGALAAAAATAASSTTTAGKITVTLMAAAKAKVAAACAAGVLLLGVTGTIAYQQFAGSARVRQVKIAPAGATYTETKIVTPTTIPSNWEPRFKEAYSLKPGEMAKFIPAPFIPERLGYYLKAFGQGQYSAMPKGPDTMGLLDDGTKFDLRNAMFGGPPDVRYAANYAMGIEAWDLRGDNRLLRKPMRGDWVTRTGTTPQQRQAAFLQIVSEVTKSKVSMVKEVIPREAIVIRGKLELHPIMPKDPSPGRHTPVVLYRGKFNPKSTGYSGGDFVSQLAGITATPVIDEAGIPQNAFEVHNGGGVYMSDSTKGQQRQAEIDGLLANIAKQTSLELKNETRVLPVWTMSTTP